MATQIKDFTDEQIARAVHFIDANEEMFGAMGYSVLNMIFETCEQMTDMANTETA